MKSYGISSSWLEIIGDEFEKDYFKKLWAFVEEEYKTSRVYPSYEDIFKSLDYTDYREVKVIILGQDPYHTRGQAEGLAFSIKAGGKISPSLRNIFKEINRDLGLDLGENTSLVSWANQGVLLLNTILTVRESEPGSHKNKGWEEFTDQIIKKLNEKKDGLIFILLGNYAKEKKSLIDKKRHYILESSHPSPFSAHRGFLGSGIFSRTNEILKDLNKEEIDWEIK